MNNMEESPKFSCNIQSKTPEVSNQKNEGWCVSMVLADMVGTIVREYGHRPNLTLSPQPMIDCRMWHSQDDIIKFCTDLNYGFQSVRDYPFSRTERDHWTPASYENNEVDSPERYVVEQLDYVDDPKDIRIRLSKNFRTGGEQYPIFGVINPRGFSLPKVAARAYSDGEPYEYKPARNTRTRVSKPNERQRMDAIVDKYDHAILIVGFDTMDDNEFEHFCWVKSTYGEKWGIKGFSRVYVDLLLYLYVPTYNYSTITKLKEEHNQKLKAKMERAEDRLVDDAKNGEEVTAQRGKRVRTKDHAFKDEDNFDAEHMEKDVNRDCANVEALNCDDLNSVSDLQKTQLYTDIMKKVEDALDKGSDMWSQSIVLKDDPEYLLIVGCNNLLDEDKIFEEIMESSKVETESFRAEVAKVRTELKPWEKQLIEHQGKLEVASTEKQLLSEKHEAGRAGFVNAQKQLDDIQKRIATTTSSMEDMKTKLKKNELESSKARKVEQECLKEQETLIARKQAARQKVAELKSVMETERNQGSVLKALLQAKASNEIEGIYGRMGDLGAIDGKYDVAVSTVVSGLDFIVVETTAAADACVAMLRKNNLGVATFMIMDIDKNSSEINWHEVQIDTGQNMLKKLTNGIEESKKEKERLIAQKESVLNTFKEIEQKVFKVQDDYKKTEELINQHKDVLEKAKSEYGKLKKTVDELRTFEVDANYKLQDMKRMLKELETKEKGYKAKLVDLNNTLSKHMEQIKKGLVDPEKLQATLGDESFATGSDLKRALEMVALLEARMKEMNPNLDSISDYWKKVSVYNERVEELNLVTNERDETKKQYDEWRKKRLDEFMAGFNTISLKLKEMYQMITLGGDAELELVDSLDPFSEGVVFSVGPPKKSLKNIANLSGGEKTLSSLALVFALHHYNPTPLYVMDEIDAALDFKNVSIVGHYVKDCTKMRSLSTSV